MNRAVRPAEEASPTLGDTPGTCRRCQLWQCATQAVVGEGPSRARVMLVGEQPGHEEDLGGRPFIGPAGRVLDDALVAAGLSRRDVYLTNAIKHFKWEARGKRRLHKRPKPGEVRACAVWLETEIAAVRPQVIVALGATALYALTGVTLAIERARQGTFRHHSGVEVVPTYHPAAVLRANGAKAERLSAGLVAGLHMAAETTAHRD